MFITAGPVSPLQCNCGAGCLHDVKTKNLRLVRAVSLVCSRKTEEGGSGGGGGGGGGR